MRSDDNEAKRTAWAHLATAAGAYSRTPNGDSAQALADAAIEWATVKGHGGAEAKPGRIVGTGGRELRCGVVMPFGRSKGVAIEEADAKDLAWVAKALGESIDNPEKQRWRAANVATLEAIEKELATR